MRRRSRVRSSGLWELKRNGYAESTIETTSQRLKQLAKNVDIDDPESVKDYVADKDCSKAYKSGLVDCYDRYVRYNELSWSKPNYRREDPIIRLPTSERIDRIISSCHLKHCLEFTLIKEAGLRPIELHNLTLKEIDLENGIISVRTAKHGKARVVRIQPRTLGMLKTYVSKHSKGLTDSLFSDPKTMSKAFQRARDRTAIRYQDPECFKVRLYDLRHFYGSMLYHDTKDLLYVKEKMGHRSISSTMRYMHLVEFEEHDQYVVKVAESLEEFSNLLSKGFEYISDYEGNKVLRKRK